jgi:hypothetical protein
MDIMTGETAGFIHAALELPATLFVFTTGVGVRCPAD